MTKPRSSYALLRNRNFTLLASSRFFLVLALQLQTVVVGWQVYEIKKDPLYLGLIGLAEAAPAMSLALFAGHVVDRGNPLAIARWMLLVALAGSMALLIASGLAIPAEARVSLIFAVIFLSGVVRAFIWPAEFSLTPLIVGPAWLSVAATWMGSLFQAGAITGPAIGGVLYAWRGAGAAYGVSSALVAASALLLWLIRMPASAKRARDPVRTEEPLRQSLVAGARFVFSNQIILAALSLDMFAVFFGGATALLPIFAGEILKSGPESLGVLRAAPAVGALLMGGVLIHRPVGKGAGRLLLGAVAGYGACMIGFGLSRSLWLSVLLLGLSGAFDAVSVVVRHTILQLWTPEDMRGRVSAVNMIFIGSSNEIGELESGIAARLLGTVSAVVFGGVMTLVVVATAAWKAPKLRELEIERPGQGSP